MLEGLTAMYEFVSKAAEEAGEQEAAIQAVEAICKAMETAMMEGRAIQAVEVRSVTRPRWKVGFVEKWEGWPG